jgi:26S proteasome regulatory subunit N10
VLVTHTKEIGQIIGGVHAAGLKIGGSIDIPTALNVAQLALKHRENKNQRQRVIVFAASPVETDQDTMVKLARKLKKNNIAVDIVAFGDAIGPEGGEHVLRTFVEAVNSSDNSCVYRHFVLRTSLICDTQTLCGCSTRSPSSFRFTDSIAYSFRR